MQIVENHSVPMGGMPGPMKDEKGHPNKKHFILKSGISNIKRLY